MAEPITANATCPKCGCLLGREQLWPDVYRSRYVSFRESLYCIHCDIRWPVNECEMEEAKS